MTIQTNTATSLADIKAASTSNISIVYDRSLWTWASGDYSGRADEQNIIKANNTPLSSGAWVRQRASEIQFDGRTVDGKLREEVSVKDGRFGAKGDAIVTYAADGSVATITGSDDTAAINAALAIGGRVKVPRGAYRITGRLLVVAPNTEFVLEAGVIIAGSPWRYSGQQLPFGAAVLITAANCSVTGAGIGSSTIALTGGSEANAITFLHCDGGYVGNLTLDGGQAAVTAVEDDTFMTGVNVLNATGGNLSGKHTRVTIEKVEARRWAQYGLQAYGDLAGVEFINCHVHHNGSLDQLYSRGAGIAVTRGNRNVSIRGCTIEDNKQDGIFQTSAGLDSYDLSFTDNIIRGNGRWGITCTEEANFASAPGKGTRRIAINGNIVTANGGRAYDSKGGIRAGTYDGVGFLSDLTSSGNLIVNNTGRGWLIQTNDDAINRTSRVYVDDVVSTNSIEDIGLGPKLDETVRWNASKATVVVNFGDSALNFRARGAGSTVASASTLTIPAFGDAFKITGNATITTITAEPGREVTFVSSGSPTFAITGNIVAQSPIVLAGNSTLTLRCFGQSWFRTGGSTNA